MPNEHSNELKNVLLVEDDADIQAVALIALEDVGGLSVRACSSGREALAAVRDFRPDVVLLDVMMPGLTGPETLRELRAVPGMSDVPVVFMTARVQQREVNEYLALGAVGVIPKPFEPMTLANDVRELVRAARDAENASDERAFEDELEFLRARFIQDLPTRARQVQEAWERAKRGDAPVSDVLMNVHSLVGTARTLRLDEVGQAAANAEVALEQLDGQASRADAELEALLVELSDVMQRHAGTEGTA